MSADNAAAKAADTAGFFRREIQSAGNNEPSGEEQQDSSEQTEPAGQEDENLEDVEPEENAPEGEDPDGDIDPDDPEKKRYRYWQSKYDKTQAEMAAMKKQLEQFGKVPKEAVDLAATLLESPDVVEVVEAYLKTGQKPGKAPSGPSAQEQLASLQKPKPPEKPVDFDEEDAMTDPRSESAKYRKAYEQYRDSLNDYLVKRDELRDLVEQEKSAKYTQEKRKEEQEALIRRELTVKFGLTAAEVDELHQIHAQPLTLEDAVLFYKLKTGKIKPAVQAAQRASEADKKTALKATNPPPPAKGAGAAKPSKSDFFRR